MRFELKMNDEEGRLCALRRANILDTEPEPWFEEIVELVKDVLHVPMCAVSLVDAHRQWFKARRGLGVSETPRDVSFCTHTIASPGPLLIRDATADARFSNNLLVVGEPHIRSYAGVPLTTSDGYNLGSLCIIDTITREFDPREVKILSKFAKLVIDELELRRMVSIDQLTNALTRRAWLQLSESEVQRAHRYGRPLSIAVFDIDHFKSINDTFGHPAGDMVLADVAFACTSKLRDTSSLGRLGGEEFGLLLVEANADEALRTADRFRTLIEETSSKEDGEPLVTASFGVATLDGNGESLGELIQRADLALYEAKRNGRNCCRAASQIKHATLPAVLEREAFVM